MSNRKTHPHRGLKVRPRGRSWQVDFGTRDGKRHQKSYPSMDEAKAAIDEFLTHRSEQDRLDRIDEKNKRFGLYDLTDAQRLDVMTALERLHGHSSLTEAADFYLDHNSPEAASCTVSELVDRYIEAKRKANRRERTIADIRSRLGQFRADYGDTLVHEVTTTMIEQWLDKRGYRDLSRENYRRHLVYFYNFAIKHSFAKINPAAKIEKVSIDEKIPGILTVPEVERVMRSAQHHMPYMVPYFAIGFFAGLRPTETEQLDWRDIDLVRRRIVVRPQVAKKRRQRYVDISDNLAQWLTPHRKDRGQIHFSRFRFEKVRKQADVTWVHDAMRHSFGSYHLARHEDAAKTALQMGHTSNLVLFNHYRDLVEREQAEAYWEVMPSEGGGVIQLGGDSVLVG